MQSSRVSKRANSRSDLLLDAAARLFAAQGYRATSMRDIAKAVDMLPGSIYYHFASKDDLLLRIYELGVAQITTALEEAIEPQIDPWQRLEAGMAALIHAVTQESAFTRVIFKVTPEDVPTYARELVAFRDQFELRFRALIEELPVSRWVDPHLLRLLLLGAGNHAQLWFSAMGKHTPEEISAQFCRLIREPVDQ